MYTIYEDSSQGMRYDIGKRAYIATAVTALPHTHLHSAAVAAVPPKHPLWLPFWKQ